MQHIGKVITAAIQKALVSIEVNHFRMVRAVTPTPATKALYAAVYGSAFAFFMFIPTAHAQQSLGDSANSAGQTSDAFKTLAGKVGLLGGAAFGVGGGFKMHQKSKEGENSQVKMGTILGLFGAGVLSAGAGAILLRAGASIGLQSSDYGTVPGN